FSLSVAWSEGRQTIVCPTLRAVLLGLLWQSRDLHHGTDFDRAQARARNLCRDAYRLVEVFGVDQEVAAEVLARLGERTVSHEPFAFAHPDAGRRRGRMQRGGSQIMPTRIELMRELRGLSIAMLPLGLAHRLLVKVNQQHISHLSSSIG